MRTLKLDTDALRVETFAAQAKSTPGAALHQPSDAADSCWYGCPAQSISGINPCFC